MTILEKVQEKRKGSKKAFTLLEISVVLILVGLLIVGVVGGQVLIQKAQLAKAKSLTSSSPMIMIEDLNLWMETTLDEDDLI
jgi:prepilin-type N-terminal cleavage/methylation domain-containing protein